MVEPGGQHGYLPGSTESSPTLRVATYNVHGCVGLDRQRSESRIAEVIASLSADVVGLQELDANRKRSGGVDQAAVIAQQLGWKHYFHPAIRVGDEHYGDAIVSRHPLTLQRGIDLPGSGAWYCREQRIAIWAEIETDLGPLQFINSHFGLGRGERTKQAQLLMGPEVLGGIGTEQPLVLLGDFNSIRWSRSFRIVAGHLRDVRSLVSPTAALRTFPTRFPLLAVDHIFVNAALEASSLQVHRTPLARVASDHYPLVAELVRPAG
ncbi:MAG: endonuclease/exonuclease/phosphatase family protein, partial [Chthoniobacterales bacterium]